MTNETLSPTAEAVEVAVEKQVVYSRPDLPTSEAVDIIRAAREQNPDLLAEMSSEYYATGISMEDFLAKYSDANPVALGIARALVVLR